jgi:hypothetical protein
LGDDDADSCCAGRKGWLCFLPEVSRDSALIGIVVYFSLLKPFAGQS